MELIHAIARQMTDGRTSALPEASAARRLLTGLLWWPGGWTFAFRDQQRLVVTAGPL